MKDKLEIVDNEAGPVLTVTFLDGEHGYPYEFHWHMERRTYLSPLEAEQLYDFLDSHFNFKLEND